MKRQKCISLLVVLLGLAILMAGCSTGDSSPPAEDAPPPPKNTPTPSRDMSTPSSRLVGHWLNDVQGWQDWYGPVDEVTKIGGHAQLDDDGEVFYSQYRIVSEALGGELVTFELLLTHLDPVTMDFLVSRDGLTMKNAANPIMTHTYMDSKTKP